LQKKWSVGEEIGMRFKTFKTAEGEDAAWYECTIYPSVLKFKLREAINTYLSLLADKGYVVEGNVTWETQPGLFDQVYQTRMSSRTKFIGIMDARKQLSDSYIETARQLMQAVSEVPTLARLGT
jgi:hypothetical protein